MSDYDRIKRFGYVIDVRAPLPVLIRNVSARAFNSFEEAVDGALNELLRAAKDENGHVVIHDV